MESIKKILILLIIFLMVPLTLFASSGYHFVRESELTDEQRNQLQELRESEENRLETLRQESKSRNLISKNAYTKETDTFDTKPIIIGFCIVLLIALAVTLIIIINSKEDSSEEKTCTQIYKQIRNQNIKSFLYYLFFALLFTIITIFLWIGQFQEEFSLFMLIITIGMSVATICIDYITIKSLMVIISPASSMIFKKYGNSNEIEKILNKINNNIVYQDDSIIISKDYAMKKNDIESIVSFDNVLAVYKMINKQTGVIVSVSYQVAIIDKYNDLISFSYSKDEEEKANEVISILAKKCKNAKIGYSQETLQYVKNNKVSLNGRNTNIITNVQQSTNKLNNSEKKTHKQNNNSVENSLLNNESNLKETRPKEDKYDKLAKLKKLYDDEALTKEEFEREKAKLLK